jgi:predicted CopG family antitoxin
VELFRQCDIFCFHFIVQWTYLTSYRYAAMVFNATFNNILTISLLSVLVVEETGVTRKKPPTCLKLHVFGLWAYPMKAITVSYEDCYCIRWRLLLYLMKTITVSDEDYYCILWRLLLYPMKTITVSDEDYYCIRWRLLLYPMKTITVSYEGYYCILWRLLLYPMKTITVASNAH